MKHGEARGLEVDLAVDGAETVVDMEPELHLQQFFHLVFEMLGVVLQQQTVRLAEVLPQAFWCQFVIPEDVGVLANRLDVGRATSAVENDGVAANIGSADDRLAGVFVFNDQHDAEVVVVAEQLLRVAGDEGVALMVRIVDFRAISAHQLYDAVVSVDGGDVLVDVAFQVVDLRTSEFHLSFSSSKSAGSYPFGWMGVHLLLYQIIADLSIML